MNRITQCQDRKNQKKKKKYQFFFPNKEKMPQSFGSMNDMVLGRTFELQCTKFHKKNINFIKHKNFNKKHSKSL